MIPVIRPMVVRGRSAYGDLQHPPQEVITRDTNVAGPVNRGLLIRVIEPHLQCDLESKLTASPKLADLPDHARSVQGKARNGTPCSPSASAHEDLQKIHDEQEKSLGSEGHHGRDQGKVRITLSRCRGMARTGRGDARAAPPRSSNREGESTRPREARTGRRHHLPRTATLQLRYLRRLEMGENRTRRSSSDAGRVHRRLRAAEEQGQELTGGRQPEPRQRPFEPHRRRRATTEVRPRPSSRLADDNRRGARRPRKIRIRGVGGPTREPGPEESPRTAICEEGP